MDDAVGLVEMLRAASADVVLGAGIWVEAGDIGGMGVELGITMGHPFGDCPTRPGPFLDPDRRGRPEVLHLDGFSDQRHRIRRQ